MMGHRSHIIEAKQVTLNGSRRVGLARRLAAAGYDALLLVAVWFGATALLLPFNGGEAIAPGNWLYSGYLVAWALGYFLWPWLKGGQTLGMRAWRIRLVAGQGALTWQGACVRWLVALISWAAAGLGFWWALSRRDRRTWHDLASGTHLERTGLANGKKS